MPELYKGKTNAVVNVSSGSVDNSDAIIDGSVVNVNTNVTKVASYKFYKCSNLQSFKGLNVTQLEASSFNECSNISDLDMPNLETINGINCFSSCESLESIDFPKLTTIGNYTFYYCTALKNVNLPNLINMGNAAFSNCTSLKNISLPKITTIKQQTFLNVKSLKITLSVNQVVTLENSNAFSKVIGNTTTVYVPSNLIESYKVATNWSTLYNDSKVRFSAITE